MKELNLNGFYKMCDKFSSYHKLDENETRRLYAFIGENFDDDFANYDIEADKSWHSICSHMFAMCYWMAFGSLEFPLSKSLSRAVSLEGTRTRFTSGLMFSMRMALRSPTSEPGRL